MNLDVILTMMGSGKKDREANRPRIFRPRIFLAKPQPLEQTWSVNLDVILSMMGSGKKDREAKRGAREDKFME